MKKGPLPPSGGRLRGPGILESLRELFFGAHRVLDCVQVEVSTRCPGRCTYCPHTIQQEQWKPQDMGLDTFTALWPLLRRSARVHLQGWGEPLLNPAFFDMAALARKAGCAVSTTTCGLIMDESLALRLVESGLDIVAFSLAGTTEKSNLSRRGVDFERVLTAISTLQKVRRARQGVHLEIHLAYLMLASQMEAVRDLPPLMHQLGVHAAVVSTLDYLPCASLASEGFAPHETEKIERASAILRASASEARRLGMEFHWALPKPDAAGTQCRENIARSLFVSADGFVSPCVYVNVPAMGEDARRLVFGNVREQDPVEIWESESFRRFRKRLEAGEPGLPCLTCPKRFEH
jgi:MoaA/NifB/PqqE/SkfB family radical SAM enzyme